MWRIEFGNTCRNLATHLCAFRYREFTCLGALTDFWFRFDPIPKRSCKQMVVSHCAGYFDCVIFDLSSPCCELSFSWTFANNAKTTTRLLFSCWKNSVLYLRNGCIVKFASVCVICWICWVVLAGGRCLGFIWDVFIICASFDQCQVHAFSLQVHFAMLFRRGFVYVDVHFWGVGLCTLGLYFFLRAQWWSQRLSELWLWFLPETTHAYMLKSKI